MARFAFLHPNTTVEMVDEILASMAEAGPGPPEHDAQRLDVLRAGHRPRTPDEEEGHAGDAELGAAASSVRTSSRGGGPARTSSVTSSGTPTEPATSRKTS